MMRGFVPWADSFALWDVAEVLSVESILCFRIRTLVAE